MISLMCLIFLIILLFLRSSKRYFTTVPFGQAPLAIDIFFLTIDIFLPGHSLFSCYLEYMNKSHLGSWGALSVITRASPGYMTFSTFCPVQKLLFPTCQRSPVARSEEKAKLTFSILLIVSSYYFWMFLTPRVCGALAGGWWGKGKCLMWFLFL